ncbi:MAG: branched-chain amino acid ABC transporter permease [Deltaproteobacteria bacterium]|nr:branched-chain amino acid ABC transporter permease [Deltaproteobacteria bacterium]
MDYIFYILILVDIYIILAVSLNLLMGFTGLISMAHAGFMAIGAYTTTLLMTRLGMNFLLTIPLGVLIAGVVSALLALPSLRVKGEHYIIASFGLQIILYNISLNWVSLTNGPYGFSGIPRPQIFGYAFSTYRAYLVLASLITLVCVFIVWRVTRSRFGLILKGIREDEVATSSLGQHVNRFKVVTCVVGSSIAAVAGSLYATAISFIDPFCFTIHDSIFMLAIVIIGGTGNIFGSALGALLLISLPEILKFFQVAETVAAPLRQMIYGALLVVFMRFRPQGLLPEYRAKKE